MNSAFQSSRIHPAQFGSPGIHAGAGQGSPGSGAGCSSSRCGFGSVVKVLQYPSWAFCRESLSWRTSTLLQKPYPLKSFLAKVLFNVFIEYIDELAEKKMLDRDINYERTLSCVEELRKKSVSLLA